MHALRTLTDYNEGVVDIDAAEAIRGFADESPGVLSLHLFDAQSVLEDPEAHPATVDVAPVFGPHDEGRWVTLDWAVELHCAPDTYRLPMGHLL